MAQHAHDARYRNGAANSERLDGLTHEGNTLEGEAIERMSLVTPRHARDMVEAGGESRRDKAAIAPRGAPPDALRFQHHDRSARSREGERRRQPGEPAANDADIRFDARSSAG